AQRLHHGRGLVIRGTLGSRVSQASYHAESSSAGPGHLVAHGYVTGSGSLGRLAGGLPALWVDAAGDGGARVVGGPGVQVRGDVEGDDLAVGVADRRDGLRGEVTIDPGPHAVAALPEAEGVCPGPGRPEF